MEKFVIYSEKYGYCRRGMKNLKNYQCYDFSDSVEDAITYSTLEKATGMAKELHGYWGTVVVPVTIMIMVHDDQSLDPTKPIDAQLRANANTPRFQKPKKSAAHNFLY